MNPNSFTLKATNAAFSQRQRDVFDQLKVLENNRHNTGIIQDNEMETDQQTPIPRKQRSVTKHFRGKESIFKQPQDRAPKNFIMRIPDFKKNPHKWTRYSLSDVKEEDISDKANTNAALSFLKELKHRRGLELQEDSSSNKILFHKPKLNQIKSKFEDDSKPSFRSSKVVMPEYVVGQKIKKDKKKDTDTIKQGKVKELKLEHLMEDDIE